LPQQRRQVVLVCVGGDSAVLPGRLVRSRSRYGRRRSRKSSHRFVTPATQPALWRPARASRPSSKLLDPSIRLLMRQINGADLWLPFLPWTLALDSASLFFWLFPGHFHRGAVPEASEGAPDRAGGLGTRTANVPQEYHRMPRYRSDGGLV